MSGGCAQLESDGRLIFHENGLDDSISTFSGRPSCIAQGNRYSLHR